MSSYVYSIQNDTLNQAVNVRLLNNEIISASLITQLAGVTTAGDVLTIDFNASLSSEDEITLTSIVEGHAGGPSATDPAPVEIINSTQSQPFSSKQLTNGGKLYSRVQGVKFSVTTGANTCYFSVPWSSCKITGIEVINGEAGDTVDMKVLDDSIGSYSTIPNYLFNQFGYTVAVAPNFYSRESTYDADLYQNMVVEVIYNSVTDKDIWINYILHEVK